MEDNNVKVTSGSTMSKIRVSSRSKASKKQKQVMVWVAVVVLVVVSLSAAGYYYKKYNDIASNPSSAQSEKNKAETTRVLDNLKAAILITEKDAPTVARIEEPEKLKKSNPTFYKDIQKGDYLIIFPKRAIVYREANDQIINIAPIINTADLKAREGTTPTSDTKKTNE